MASYCSTIQILGYIVHKVNVDVNRHLIRAWMSQGKDILVWHTPLTQMCL